MAVFCDEIYLPHPYGFANEGVLHTLPPPIPYGDILADKTVISNRKNSFNMIYGKLIDEYEGMHPYHSVGVTKDLEDVSLVLHATYAKKMGPELFIENSQDTSTSRLASFVVKSHFEYYVPQLQALNADQILEVRNHIKDTREGFVSYIFEMVDDISALVITQLSHILPNATKGYLVLIRDIASTPK